MGVRAKMPGGWEWRDARGSSVQANAGGRGEGEETTSREEQIRKEIRDERRMLLETLADAGKSLSLLRTKRISSAQTAVDAWSDSKRVGGRQRRFQTTMRMWMSWKGCGGTFKLTELN